MISLATDDSLMPASSSSFSNRCTSRVLSRVMCVRARVRCRSCRIGSGGTNEARTMMTLTEIPQCYSAKFPSPVAVQRVADCWRRGFTGGAWRAAWW